MVIRTLLLAPLIVLLVLFCLSNRQETAFRLWPFDVAVMAPLAYAVLAVAALAFLFGAVVAWGAGAGARRRARRLAAAADVMEAELIELRGRLAKDIGPVPAVAGTSLRLRQPVG